MLKHVLKEEAGKLQSATVVNNRCLTADIFHLTLAAPVVAAVARPGQFVMVRVSAGQDLILRRPFSLHRLIGASGQIEIMYRVAGQGTARLAGLPSGAEIELLGPLGNGFSWTSGQRIGLVGGGMGIAPLLAAAEQAVREGNDVVSFLGASTAGGLLARGEFARLGPLHVCTDDGSAGLCGHIGDLLRADLDIQRLDLVLGCGPVPMLKALARMAAARNIPAQLSLEERMGCGIGACLGCVVPVKAPTPEAYVYKRVCSDGPVFCSQELIFDWPPGSAEEEGCSCEPS